MAEFTVFASQFHDPQALWHTTVTLRAPTEHVFFFSSFLTTSYGGKERLLMSYRCHGLPKLNAQNIFFLYMQNMTFPLTAATSEPQTHHKFKF